MLPAPRPRRSPGRAPRAGLAIAAPRALLAVPLLTVLLLAAPLAPLLGGASRAAPAAAAGATPSDPVAAAGPLAGGLAPRAPGTAPDPDWVWPVDGPRVVDRPFLAPPTPYVAGHRGVDLAARSAVPDGAIVRSPADGVVHFAGRVVDRGVVTVRAGPLLVTVEPVTAAVAEGDAVAAGQPLGVLEPGHCAEPCVHLGVREAGLYVSPMRWLGGLQRAVLLPLGVTGG